jgi:hypothetical protein
VGIGGGTVRSLIAIAISLALPAGAAAHGAEAPAGMSESELRAYETEVLGPEHAAEHAEERRDERRAERRWQALSPRQQQRRIRHERRHSRRLARRTAARAPASEIGRWTHAPFALPNSYAIHSVMLPTGKILYWGFPAQPPNVGNGTLWDPSKGYGPDAFTDVPPPVVDPDGSGPQPPGVAPIYCSGQSFLADGEVLVTGGNLVLPNRSDPAYPFWAGLNRVFTFNPWTERWTQQPQMTDGRWYPTQVLLADGRTITIGGYGDEAPGGALNLDFEVFKPASTPGGVGSFSAHPEVTLPDGLLYPHMFLLPDERVAVAGPLPRHAALIDARDPGKPITWSELPRSLEQRNGGNAVLDPEGPRGSWRITMLGGIGGVPLADGSRPPFASTETINLKHPEDGWKLDSPLNISRSYQNTVLLPDRSMVTLGGGFGSDPADGVYRIDSDGARRQVELFDPDTRKWRLGPAQMEDRGYHSTAVLLPDGRVFSGGDNHHPYEPDGSWSTTDTAEIYSPPYLFKGKRPAIKKAPKRAGWNKRIKVKTKGASKATSAVLVAPAATTHGNDMNQRLVPLRAKVKKVTRKNGKKRGYKGLEIKTPPSAGVAPPGYYMLFVLNKKGVPSVAKWVQLTD